MAPSSDSEALFKRKSRTFSLAARLFGKEDRHAIARLYQFCRVMDDLADKTRSGEPDQLDQIVADLSNGGEGRRHPAAADFRALALERRLPLKAAEVLACALRDDCGPRAIASESELIQFAFGVAGTVGLLICPVLGVRDDRALPFAADLGVAFQLTNIARDIAEDAAKQRFYLPAQWVEASVIQRGLGGDHSAAILVDQAVLKILDLAEQYYCSALDGMWFIPRQNRRANFMAAVLYREIGVCMLHQGSGAWRARITVGTIGKARALLRMIPFHRRMKKTVWSRERPPKRAQFLNDQSREAGIDLSAFSLE